MMQLNSQRQWSALIGVVLLMSCAFFFCPANGYAKAKPEPKVCFSPKGGCEQTIVDTIDQAKHTILIQAASLSLYAVLEALIEAEKRGVSVEVILDKRQLVSLGAGLGFIVKAGAVVYLDGEHPIAHNSVMIMDGGTVITGSYNFTNKAEDTDAENLLILQDKTVAAKYTANWNQHKTHSEKFE